VRQQVAGFLGVCIRLWAIFFFFFEREREVEIHLWAIIMGLVYLWALIMGPSNNNMKGFFKSEAIKWDMVLANGNPYIT